MPDLELLAPAGKQSTSRALLNLWAGSTNPSSRSPHDILEKVGREWLRGRSDFLRITRLRPIKAQHGMEVKRPPSLIFGDLDVGEAHNL